MGEGGAKMYEWFVIAPFYYQNLAGAMAPQQQADGSMPIPVFRTVACFRVWDIPSMKRFSIPAVEAGI